MISLYYGDNGQTEFYESGNDQNKIIVMRHHREKWWTAMHSRPDFVYEDQQKPKEKGVFYVLCGKTPAEVVNKLGEQYRLDLKLDDSKQFIRFGKEMKLVGMMV